MGVVNLLLKGYYKLPFRPFRKQLSFIFNKYRAKDMNKIVVAKKKGINFELNLSDRVASGIYYDFYEPVITGLFEKSLKRGDVVVDVGANLGYYTLLSAKLVGDTGKVYAFEPMHSAFERIKKNVSLNNFKNIILENAGISNKEEKLKVFFQNEYRVGIEQKGEKEEVKFIVLDDYIKKHKIKKLSLLKIDTDGYDFKVVKGAINIIKKFRPIVTAEISPYEDYKNFVNFLFSIEGYKHYSDIGGRFKEFSKEDILNAVKERGFINIILKPIN